MRKILGRRSRAGTRRGLPPPAVAISLFPLLLLVIDVFNTPSVRLGPLMVAAPTFAAAFCAPAGVLGVSAVTLPCVVLASWSNQQLATENFLVQMITTALIIAAATAAASVRVHRERQLARARWVAEVTQRVLLHPLPRRVGSFDVASLYESADEEAAVGGDLYAIARHGNCSRLLLGDVQGKGLASLDMVSSVLNGFRQSVRHGSTLPTVVRELAAGFQEDVRELSAAAEESPCGPGAYADESFVTAVLCELPDEGPMRLVNLGHPEPLLLHDGKVTALEPTVPVPPLGLEDLNGVEIVVDTTDFPMGATLVLYTDGVTEARNPAGDFYPLADRLRNWTDLPPEALLAAVRADLRRHVDGPLTDDVAMVALQRTPAPEPARAPAAGRPASTRSDSLDGEPAGSPVSRTRPSPVSRIRRRPPSAATPQAPSGAASPAGP
ncbi:PP2C family protein-serine/threonine phosphatase [Streptomyces sp. NPDC020490]|uniref:PP2C family protein-serine/threonine phosphatase n=1 Tax=Streptomyces sp. NPDC020490 TaxID=3365078 RepID=UPI0037B60367